ELAEKLGAVRNDPEIAHANGLHFTRNKGRLDSFLLHQLAFTGIDLVHGRPGTQAERGSFAPGLARVSNGDLHESLCGLDLHLLVPGHSFNGLDRLGREREAEHSGPFFAELATAPAIVDLRDIAGRSQQKSDGELRLMVMASQSFSQITNIIGGESVTAHDGE